MEIYFLNAQKSHKSYLHFYRFQDGVMTNKGVMTKKPSFSKLITLQTVFVSVATSSFFLRKRTHDYVPSLLYTQIFSLMLIPTIPDSHQTHKSCRNLQILKNWFRPRINRTDNLASHSFHKHTSQKPVITRADLRNNFGKKSLEMITETSSEDIITRKKITSRVKNIYLKCC